ncbi:MAG: bifunctional glycoside hydrolase 114/ polysaccharide deacetylase family protein [Gammaproteobacteria bacterium]|nr:bifunctional glycoside hydrolase 114/ polysaccharide deacetylase family protein [Gammaproteobacteria bacterium]
MKPRRRSRRRWLVFAALALSGVVRAAGTPSIAFYYGSQPPAGMLSQFDWVVVEAANLPPPQLPALRRHGAEVFAYVSLGEIERWRGDTTGLGRELVLGRNPQWNTEVIDLTRPGWRDYILDRRIAPLWRQGYRGFFLDTLDSFELYAKDASQVARQRRALAGIIEAIHARFPGVKLLLNRGFGVLPQVHDVVVGVVAESLFKGWNAGTKTYTDVAAADRDWLLARLREVQQRYRLPVAVIDYLPPLQRQAAREDARRIQALGFTPWVSDAALDQMGVGAIEVMPRQVLMLYQLDAAGGNVAYESVNQYAAMPLEYLGFSPIYRNVREPLPADTLRGRYAGIVTWFNGPLAKPNRYRAWLLRQLGDGVPVAILGEPGVALDGELLQRMGLRAAGDFDSASAQVAAHDDLVGFETLPERLPDYQSGFLPARAGVTAHLTLRDSRGNTLAPVLTGAWGGLALSPWLIESAPGVYGPTSGEAGTGGHQRWILDPFGFFKTALHLPDMPAVDATTENGDRIATAHVDGDGFANRANLPGAPLAGQVLLERIFKRYDFPVAVSVIEGEIAPDGLYPKLAPQLERIARRIFRLPDVEIASHTYSHPFEWLALKPGTASGKYNLPIPGYRFSLAREIDGSVRYIDRRLAPPGKKTAIVLWSGSAVVPERALQLTRELGLANMNGGNTDITRANDSLTEVSPMTAPAGPYRQVYAPVMNDNIYTHGFTGPFWGFTRVIQTFELTDAPRRLKPITIYYHFFSGGRLASVEAVDKVYRYVLSRPVMPMFESTYSRLVEDFYRIGVARRLNGDWQITGATEDRTLRLPAGQWPDLVTSPQVVGVQVLPQGRYVALSGADRLDLRLTSRPPTVPYLERANGRIAQWQRRPDGFRLRVRGQVPLQITLAGLGGRCRVDAPGARRQPQSAGRLRLHYRGKDSGDVTVACR